MSSATARTPEASGKLAANIMHFGRVLREAGLPVGPAMVIDALDAAMAGPLRRREDFYWTLYAVFVKRREQGAVFEQAFHVFWKKPKMLEQLMQLMYVQIARKPDEAKRKQAGFRRLAEAMFDQNVTSAPKSTEQDSLDIEATYTASTQEQLRAKDFEQMTLAEQAEAKQALARLRLAQSEMVTRRFSPAARGRIDMRRSLRLALRSGGEMGHLAFRKPQTRLPPLVVLCDISGSCSQYSRMFLHFLHGLANDRARVHVFLFGTRLTNITRDLKRRDVDEAIARVSTHVRDWEGGTRIGACLHEFNFRWGRRVLGQGAEVLLMSDGLERDDIAALSAEMQRLHRSARRITWLNPLLRYDKFEAAASGIRAIMPHVDAFRPVHNLDSIADLARSLASRPGAPHDPKKWLETA
ncbi:MAG: VWA domain-containing protein [Alphaproteobacteria bacterium]|nr:VWA domain-containing protein [Alphaproteobacteria bacterium]